MITKGTIATILKYDHFRRRILGRCKWEDAEISILWYPLSYSSLSFKWIDFDSLVFWIYFLFELWFCLIIFFKFFPFILYLFSSIIYRLGEIEAEFNTNIFGYWCLKFPTERSIVLLVCSVIFLLGDAKLWMGSKFDLEALLDSCYCESYRFVIIAKEEMMRPRLSSMCLEVDIVLIPWEVRFEF